MCCQYDSEKPGWQDAAGTVSPMTPPAASGPRFRLAALGGSILVVQRQTCSEALAPQSGAPVQPASPARQPCKARPTGRHRRSASPRRLSLAAWGARQGRAFAAAHVGCALCRSKPRKEWPETMVWPETKGAARKKCESSPGKLSHP
ncbi:MAG: hypothetical protein BCS36_01385 [Desulfovibrio sp. MES5]|nr:MAG: hypothetical protein BCS36_01385 [Desulfovibrio sp. MES5]